MTPRRMPLAALGGRCGRNLLYGTDHRFLNVLISERLGQEPERARELNPIREFGESRTGHQYGTDMVPFPKRGGSVDAIASVASETNVNDRKITGSPCGDRQSCAQR